MPPDDLPEELTPFDDTIAELSTWAGLAERSPPPPPPPPLSSILEDALVTPRFNPYRDVGRNDPCPCGSGKKYKKCCLR